MSSEDGILSKIKPLAKMLSSAAIKRLGVQQPQYANYGVFSLVVQSSYFDQEVVLNFPGQHNAEDSRDWDSIRQRTNAFLQLGEARMGWVKGVLWENYLYAIEATDYGFEDAPEGQNSTEIKVEEITILTAMPGANIEMIKYNMGHFRIFSKDTILIGAKIESVEFHDDSIIFHISTVWDQEHDIYLRTKDYVVDP